MLKAITARPRPRCPVIRRQLMRKLPATASPNFSTQPKRRNRFSRLSIPRSDGLFHNLKTNFLVFSHKINRHTELQLIQHPHARDLYKLMDANRKHLRPWHPWIDLVRSTADVDRFITGWLQQLSN